MLAAAAQTPATTTVVVSAAPTSPVQAVTPTAPAASGFITVDAFGQHITLNPMVCALVLILIGAAAWIYHAQKKSGNGFDGLDLIMDDIPVLEVKTRRKASFIKIAFVIAFAIASWVVIDREIKNTLTIEIYAPYLTLVLGTVMAKLFWDKPFDPSAILAYFGKKGD